jgi:hypothetical protein
VSVKNVGVIVQGTARGLCKAVRCPPHLKKHGSEPQSRPQIKAAPEAPRRPVVWVKRLSEIVAEIFVATQTFMSGTKIAPIRGQAFLVVGGFSVEGRLWMCPVDGCDYTEIDPSRNQYSNSCRHAWLSAFGRTVLV